MRPSPLRPRLQLVPRGLAAAALVLAVVAGRAAPFAGPPETGAASADEVAALVAQLGNDDSAVRETAAERLAALGPDAADALLEAAESSADTEISLRARSLLESIPLASPDDPPAAAALVDRFAAGDAHVRSLALHALLRLEDDAGVEPLARIARFDRTEDGSRLAAAMLAGEWRPGDDSWEPLRAPIARGAATSRRPAARFLRALAAFGADGVAAGSDPCGEATAAVAAMAADSRAGGDPAVRLMRRCLAAMLAAADRRAEALAEAARLFESADRAAPDQRAVTNLVWLAENGLPEAGEAFRDRWPALVAENAAVAYAVAFALRAGDAAAEDVAGLAESAFALSRGGEEEFNERLRLAIVLTRWGASDWAAREFEAVLAAPTAEPGEFALAGILYSEALHDAGRNDAAATTLGRVLAGQGDVTGAKALERLDRDEESVAARMGYFEARAAQSRGDAAGARRSLEESLRRHPQDVDSLIALSSLPDNTPAQAADARARVAAAAAHIDDRIEAEPDVPDGYNEYAWLVSNTAGDFLRADRYARVALDRYARTAIEVRDESPLDGGLDSSSYLDTLAHCRAALGDHRGAVRTQSIARRLEPHNRTIARNLDRFRAREAGR